MENITTIELQRRSVLQLAGAGALATMVSTTAQAAASGMYVPGEELAQRRVWMAYPNSELIWADLLPGVQQDFATLCRTIAKYEPVSVVCGKFAKEAKAKVGKTVYPVTYISTIANDDMWMRDMGCVFRTDGYGRFEGIDLNFNGWGDKQTHNQDTLVPAAMCRYLGIPVRKASIVGEGGGVLYDGEGTLMATESCWVNDNRNPGKTRAQIEAELLKQYGACKMIWCKGLVGEDITDYHLDATAVFAAPGKIAMHRPPADADDVFAETARDCYNTLKNARDARGRKFQFTFFDQPVNVRQTSEFLLSSYINYLAVNGAVISVNFGDAVTDAKAVKNFKAMYPGRKVEMLVLDTLYCGGGGIHCVTQQQPL